MKLADFLSVIDPETYVNIIDRTFGIDYGVKLIDELYEDTFFRRTLPYNTVHNVIAVENGTKTYICIAVN